MMRFVKPKLIFTCLMCVLACGQPTVSSADMGDQDHGGSAPLDAASEEVRAVMDNHARTAVVGSEVERVASRQAIRALGPAGLAAFLAVHAQSVRELRDGTAESTAEDVQQLRAAIDFVAAQRDAGFSGLYWFTDLDEAKHAARRTGRPILSLRLLGELDEELSCANSRLFRTVLYANESVSDFLRQNFVMHWSSERPAPVVTIDMGDGRTLTRTITGNSAHYVLDSRGRFVDVLPGLYAPEPFVAALEQARVGALRCGARDDANTCVSRYHQDALVAMREAWSELGAHAQRANGSPLAVEGNAVRAFGQGLMPSLENLSFGGPFLENALDIDRLTIGKSLSERDMLRMTRIGQGLPEPNYGNAWWTVVAPLVSCGAECEPATLAQGRVLDEGARAMVRLKTGGENEQARLQALFDATLQDSVRNEFVLHRDVHVWMESATEERSFEQVNSWVYETVFLTRPSDPWMGLDNPTVYDAIER